VRAARQRIPSRDFLPWRFSDAGHWSRGGGVMRPASENLHKSGRGRDCCDWRLSLAKKPHGPGR